MKITSKEKTQISNVNRQTWKRYSVARKEIKARCRVSRGTYKCENCGKVMKGNDSVIAVDHIVPVGAVIEEGYLQRLWCSVENLWGICNDCHKLKTRLERRKTPLAEILQALKEL